ncbi:MAG: hypothetical protein ACPGUD_04125 [Parashewanella sp.]
MSSAIYEVNRSDCLPLRSEPLKQPECRIMIPAKGGRIKSYVTHSAESKKLKELILFFKRLTCSDPSCSPDAKAVLRTSSIDTLIECFKSMKCCPCIPRLFRCDKTFSNYLVKNWPKVYHQFALDELHHVSCNPEHPKVTAFREFISKADKAVQQNRAQLCITGAFGDKILAHQIHPLIFTSPEIIQHIEALSPNNRYERLLTLSLLVRYISLAKETMLLPVNLQYSATTISINLFEQQTVIIEARDKSAFINKAFIGSKPQQLTYVSVDVATDVAKSLDMKMLNDRGMKYFKIKLLKSKFDKPLLVEQTGLCVVGFSLALLVENTEPITLSYQKNNSRILMGLICDCDRDVTHYTSHVKSLLGLAPGSLPTGPYKHEWNEMS